MSTRNYRSLHFTLAHRAVASVSRLCTFSYTVHHGLLRGMRRKGGLGWVPFATAETPEQAFFRALDLRNRVVYDVGAFEGLLTLFFSRQARQVIAYEPNPTTIARLQKNIDLNRLSNVLVRPVAVSNLASETVLLFDPLMPGAATADRAVGEQVRTTAPRIQQATVETVSLDDDIAAHAFPAPDFVKIDVEGLELSVLQGMTRTLSQAAPDIYLEVHGTTAEVKEANAAAIASFLIDHGYTITHVESGTRITKDNAAAARRGHMFATARRKD